MSWGGTRDKLQFLLNNNATGKGKTKGSGGRESQRPEGYFTKFWVSKMKKGENGTEGGGKTKEKGWEKRPCQRVNGGEEKQVQRKKTKKSGPGWLQQKMGNVATLLEEMKKRGRPPPERGAKQQKKRTEE